MYGCCSSCLTICRCAGEPRWASYSLVTAERAARPASSSHKLHYGAQCSQRHCWRPLHVHCALEGVGVIHSASPDCMLAVTCKSMRHARGSRQLQCPLSAAASPSCQAVTKGAFGSCKLQGNHVCAAAISCCSTTAALKHPCKAACLISMHMLCAGCVGQRRERQCQQPGMPAACGFRHVSCGSPVHTVPAFRRLQLPGQLLQHDCGPAGCQPGTDSPGASPAKFMNLAPCCRCKRVCILPRKRAAAKDLHAVQLRLHAEGRQQCRPACRSACHDMQLGAALQSRL